jgi:hypothetical protein
MRSSPRVEEEDRDELACGGRTRGAGGQRQPQRRTTLLCVTVLALALLPSSARGYGAYTSNGWGDKEGDERQKKRPDDHAHQP